MRITIRLFFRLMYGAFAVTLASFAVLALLLYSNQRELNRRNENRFECTALANWLHMSSDELTRLVRMYAVTGDPKFESYYWYLLDVRNGKKPWPDDLHGEYWDLLTAGLVQPATTGRVVSLHDRMTETGLTDNEIALLKKAQRESDALVRTEEIAMHAMKGLYEDESGYFTRRAPPDKDFASRILNDEAYRAAKARILTPIREANRHIDQRTRQAVEERYSQGLYYMDWMLALLAITGLLAGLSLLLVRRKLLVPLSAIGQQTRAIAADMQQLSDVAHSIVQGELDQTFRMESSSVKIRSADEIGMLGRLHDAMRNQLQATGEAITRMTKDLAQRDADLQASENALVAANKELEAFSYSVSHDLRAPLRHISGFVQLLQAKARDRLDPDSLRHLDIIAAAAQKMGTLIDDLLSFSRTSRAQMHCETVALGPMVEECRRDLEPETRDRRIEWTVGPLPEVTADRALLKQVMANLLGNAVKYSRPRDPARIDVSARREGDEIVVCVRDNGAGFDMKYADKLFGVFQRLHTEAEFEGTGIGLANVRRIVSRHGGRTWAEAEVDRGASFYFSLPARPEASSKESKP